MVSGSTRSMHVVKIPWVMLLVCGATMCEGHECKCVENEDGNVHEDISCNCSYRGLTYVPDDLPIHVSELNLSNNKLNRLTNGTFSQYTSMVYLCLNFNLLNTIDSEAFAGLYNLQELHLSHNALSKGRLSFPETVFQPLTNLTVLTLEVNNMNSHPDWAFRPLVNMRKLYTDSLIVPVFGAGFAYLKNLKYLQVDSKAAHMSSCKTHRLTNETFKVFANISIHTLVASCPFVSVGTGVFTPFGSLKSLIFNKNRLGMNANLALLWSFVDRDMDEINLSSNMPNQISKAIDAQSMLTGANSKYLNAICLKKLVLHKNYISFIERSVLFETRLASCIEYIDLSKNNIIGDTFLLIQLSLFPKLRFLSLNYLPKYAMDQQFQGSMNISILVPATLETVDFSGITDETTKNDLNIDIINGTSMSKLYFTSVNMIINSKIRLSGLENVEEVDISGNYKIFNAPDILKSFLNLRYIKANKCGLNFVKNPEEIFTNLYHLEKIDLAENAISSMPKIHNPNRIRHLNLSVNAFQEIPIPIEEYSNLTILDISFNSITQFNSEIRNKLDVLFTQRKLQLRLEGNLFSCSCANLDFVQWLIETPSIFETKSTRNYSCLLENGTLSNTLFVAGNYIKIYRRCIGSYVLAYVITFLTIFLGLLSLAYLISNNPVTYKVFVLRLIGFGPKYFKKSDFNYHLNIIYSAHDLPFVFRNLRPAFEQCRDPIQLFLLERNSLGGSFKANCVVTGIGSSFKFLFVISQDFLVDDWCEFQINVALNNLTGMIPGRIVLLLMHDVELTDIPEVLLNAVNVADHVLYYADYQSRDDVLTTEIRELTQL